MKREERDLESFLSRMRSRFLKNRWHFCHVRNNPENRFEFERECERRLNLSARSSFKWNNQSWGWKDLASGRCTSLWGKPKRRIYTQIFRSSRVFRPPKHTYLEWNLWVSIKLLVLFQFGTFLFEEKAISGVTSGQRWMEWFPCYQRSLETRQKLKICCSPAGDTQPYRVL